MTVQDNAQHPGLLHLVVRRPWKQLDIDAEYKYDDQIVAGLSLTPEDERALYELLKERQEPEPQPAEVNVRVNVETEEAERQLALIESALERLRKNGRLVRVNNVFTAQPDDCPLWASESPQEPTEADESPVSLADEVVADLADELREIGVEPAEGYPKFATFADEGAAALYARVIEREAVLDQIDGYICSVEGERRVEAFQRLIDREVRIMDFEDNDGFGR